MATSPSTTALPPPLAASGHHAALPSLPQPPQRAAPRLAFAQPPGRPLPLLPHAPGRPALPKLSVANIFEPPWVFVLILMLMFGSPDNPLNRVMGRRSVAMARTSLLSASTMLPDDYRFAEPMLKFMLFMVLWQLVLRDVWDALSGQVDPTRRKTVSAVDMLAKIPGVLRYVLLVLFVMTLVSVFVPNGGGLGG